MMPADENTPPEIEPASSAARILLAVLIVVVIAAVLVSQPLFERVGVWLGEDPEKILERFDIFIAWIAVLSLPLFFGGVLIMRNGWRSAQTARFPPRGMWVLFDTPVETGPRAVFRGRMLMLAGFLMCVVAVGLPLTLSLIMHSVAGAA